MNDNSVKVLQFHELIKPVILALSELGGSGNNQQITDKLIEMLNIPEHIYQIPHSGRNSCTEFEYRVGWAKTYLKKAGYIDNPKRCVWEINDGVDIDDVDAREIVDFVRAEASKMAETLENREITKIEAGQAFEKYVLSTLAEYLDSQGKQCIFTDGAVDWDLYIPNGIDEIKCPVYVQVMYGTGNIQIRMKNYAERVSGWIDKNNDCILFITAGRISDKKFIKQNIKKIWNINTEIWDMDTLTDKMPNFPENMAYLSEPRATIVKELIRDSSYEKLKKENESKLKLLKEAYMEEKLVLVLGAGVSMDAGVPLWDELINRLIIKTINTEINEYSTSKKMVLTNKDIDTINKLAKKNKEETPLMQMRYIRAILKNEVYYNTVRDELYARKINIDTKLLNAIADLSMPGRKRKGLQGIVTYNFDNLVEQILKKRNIAYNVIHSDAQKPDAEKLSIYHVHGYLPQNEEIPEDTELIFSEEDYHRVYGDSYCWSNMAQVKAFQDNVCLFVGCSLTDPNLRRLLDEAMRSPVDTRHFAILKRKKFVAKTKSDTQAVKWYREFDDSIRNQIFKSFGISVIWVDEFSEIPGILHELTDLS